MKKILITGGSGFIGSHLSNYLRNKGYWTRCVDIKPHEWGELNCNEFVQGDLRDAKFTLDMCQGMDEVYALAADMGGMGYISQHHVDIMCNNTLININTLNAARAHHVGKYLFTSSACVYNEDMQEEDAMPLKEEDAFPAQPAEGYGWEKLYTELLCYYYMKEFAGQTGLDIRIARFHNIFGQGTWKGGREKAPAALMRKVAVAKLTGHREIEIWGDGEQIRSFCYIDDCLEMLYRLVNSTWPYPLNIGTDEDVTINELAMIIAKVARLHNPKLVHVEGPQGVRSRNADLTRMREILGFEPRFALEDGIRRTYPWIEAHVKEDLGIA